MKLEKNKLGIGLQTKQLQLIGFSGRPERTVHNDLIAFPTLVHPFAVDLLNLFLRSPAYIHSYRHISCISSQNTLSISPTALAIRLGKTRKPGQCNYLFPFRHEVGYISVHGDGFMWLLKLQPGPRFILLHSEHFSGAVESTHFIFHPSRFAHTFVTV